MKKLLLSLVMITGFLTTFAQRDESERKLGVKEIPIELLMRAVPPGQQKLDCNCEKNFLKDGGFKTVTSVGSDILATSPIWKPLTRSPQHTKIMGACDSGFVSMWGNKTVGESISQTGISLQKGKCYTVKFNARFVDQTGKQNPYVQLAVQGFNGSVNPFPLTSAATVSAPISNTAWASYSITFTANNNFNSIALFPVNGNAQNDGSFVSWIQLDNVCLQECCTVPDDKCNADFKFSLKPGDMGFLQIDANPLVSTGAEHYWAIVYANDINDNSHIPFYDILTKKTWGIRNSNGVTYSLSKDPVDTHTITGSTSKYGYGYGGVLYGNCMKITHYIKCCEKWYAVTKVFCTKLCEERKEGTIKDVTEEVNKDLSRLANNGRG